MSQIFHYRIFCSMCMSSIDVAIPWHVWYGNATFLNYDNLLNAMIQNSLSWCHTHGTPFLWVNIQSSILFSMNRRLWCIYLPWVYDVTNFICYKFLLKRKITLSCTAFRSFNWCHFLHVCKILATTVNIWLVENMRCICSYYTYNVNTFICIWFTLDPSAL